MYWDNSALSYVDPLLCHNCLEKIIVYMKTEVQ